MSRIKVAVLRGGPSVAYDESLKTGGYVLSLLREFPEAYEPFDVFISKDGEWHAGGIAAEPHRILARAHVVWNALHGEYGESGEVQRLLESLHVPFVGSGVAASALSHNKDLARNLYQKHGIPTMSSAAISQYSLSEAELVRIFRTFLHPVVVKPATGVRGINVRLAYTYPELKAAVMKGLERATKVIVEEFVSGTVSSVHIVEEARGESLHALVPAYLETHYRRVRPLPEQNWQMEAYAKKAHEALGLRHYSASDFIVTPRGKIYILETNSQPLFFEDSLLHQSLESSGWQPKDFVEHALSLALGK
jgi:D-alanine-D-alanine ligase